MPEIQASVRADDVIKKHDQQLQVDLLTNKGADSTTKKIVQSSLNSFNKMKGFDDVTKNI